MRIRLSIYNELVYQSKKVPPETGGILGYKHENEVIEYLYRDVSAAMYGGYYQPDIPSINQIILRWQKENILFGGLFHTHRINWPDLSNGDKYYIREIVKTLLSEGEYLYFPIVFPQKGIAGFKAGIRENHIYIEPDNIEIIEN